MKVTKLKTNKFKTNMCALFLTMPLNKETVSKNALIASVLRTGSKNIQSQEEISKKLEEMYGAGFNCGVDKIQNYHVMKFYIEVLDNEYTLSGENLLQEAIDLLFEIVFNPLVENEGFKQEYFEIEKLNLIRLLNAQKDNKSQYAKDRCIEEMFENEPYGLYKYGEAKEVEKLDSKSLYSYYKEMINNCRIDLIISGNSLDNIKIPNIEGKELPEINIHHTQREQPKIIKEKTDIVQGKLLIGVNAPDKNIPAVSIYNAILGGGANSKLFQNVREKASLAYSAGSVYIKRQNTILIQTGIEIKNYEKTLKIIKEQLEDMKQGKISQSEFESAKTLMLESVRQIAESHEDMITFCFDQELFGNKLSVEEFCNALENVTPEDVTKVAQTTGVDTVYFLE